MGEPNIAELAVAAWRLERWLDNLNAEIIQTNSPVVKRSGSVIQYGKVILGLEIKEQKTNNEVKSFDEVTQCEKNLKPSESNPVLSQGPIYVDNYGGYQCWVRQFNCRAVREGYYALIGVFSNVDTEICLMDEQVYKEYQNGLFPRSPFIYKPKAGATYIAPPYPDTWYMIVCPPFGADCIENRFDSNCEWKKKPDEIRCQDSVPGKDQASQETSKEIKAPRTSVQDETETKKPEESHQTENSGQVQPRADCVNPELDGRTKTPEDCEMSEKEFERLQKKNISSFYKMSAVERGLFQIHGKKKK